MPRYQLLQWGLNAAWCILVFAYGACIGSLINVIVYRMPRGLSIVTPPSRCPACSTRLTWRDNIPVFGWLLLRGRCRYCRAPVSPEYPIVEAFVGVLFVAFYVLFYLVPPGPSGAFLGIDWASIRPAFFDNHAVQTWPIFVVLLFLVGSLVAMTIVDARTFTIPLEVAWAATLVGVIVHPLTAAIIGIPHFRARGWWWAIPTPDPGRWDWILVSIGGVVGLGVAILLLKLGLIRRSFADYPEWEAKALADHAAMQPAPADTSPQASDPLPQSLPPPDSTPFSSAESQLPDAGVSPEPSFTNPAPSLPASPAPQDLWIQYPHARREMFKELAFLAPAAMLMLAGWYAGRYLTGAGAAAPPFWLTVLAGSLMGYLIGGGVVWFVRIFGSLAFGKEAMGLGDVHLMAAVGACLGWIDATLAFFAAAFVGLFWFILATAFSGAFRRTMPYGPYLAVSTLLVVLCKPLFVKALSLILGQPVVIP